MTTLTVANRSRKTPGLLFQQDPSNGPSPTMTTKLKLSRARNKSRDTPDEASNNCPTCATPIEGFAASGPLSRTVEPCGCVLPNVRASDIAQEN
ncbi:hypothetical protein [Haloferax sp. KTX1]|uniref:hypothetical protein n=1 Tax=Haloferax sp. KTX1 TaxID=2600597 RepID=UPI002102D6A1|nr:hypothetical protein [Haloferax sp. KTX1]